MLTLDDLSRASAQARNYPELAGAFRRLGLHSYTVDVASHATLYRSMDGQVLLRPGQSPATPVTAAWNEAGVRAAIARNQRGESDYAGFMQDIAAAGVKRYEAMLAGPHPRCIYFGGDSFLEEPIPL